MRSLSWALLLPSLLAGSALATSFPVSSLKGGSSTPGSVVPNKFIVEVDSTSDIPTKRDVASREAHEALYSAMRKRGVSFGVDKEFNSQGLFVGAAVTLSNPSDSSKVADLSGVKAIRPVIRVPGPKPVSAHVVTGPHDSALPVDTESVHVLTGVDKLHARGISGKGIKIGIIDTGTDYTHPALGGGIGPGFKVIGGFDFVGDAYTGSNTPVPDDNPLDQCNGHGTHVAGIIGADPNNAFNISGVAFEASITSYRIFGCSGSVTDDIIVDALLRGVKEGQDILTMSLGGADGWTESTSSVVSSRISATGKIVTIAAGNDGSKGAFYTSSPGNAIDAISVASLDNTVISLQNATVTGIAHAPITYFATFPLPITTTLPIFATNTDPTVVDDACDPLPDSTPDLSKFIVIVRRGTCTFVQKLTNIAAKGGQFALIYDNGNGFSAIDVGTFNASLIQAADGVDLVNAFAAGKTVSLSFPQTGAAFQFPDAAGGLISSFTSFGPTNDLFFKPAVAAPGGNILSTFPVPLGSFAILSGTSMATPFMAGVSALLFSVKGRSPQVGTTARTLFETTAQLVGSSHTDGDPLQSAIQQGAGLVDAFKALTTDIIVSPGELLTNDTAHFKSAHTFTVKNTGRSIKSFNVTHIPAGTALSLTPGTSFFVDGPVPLSPASAHVTFSPRLFTVRPGQSQTVSVKITPPSGLDPTILPVFSGFIQVANPTESLHVTYLGLGSSLKDTPVVDTTPTFFGVPLPIVVDGAGNFVTTDKNFTFVDADVPTLLARINFGTRIFRADLVSKDIKVKTTLNQSPGEKRGLFSFPQRPGGSFAKVKTIGSLFEFDFIPRNSDVNDGTGFNQLELGPTFANGTVIPNGQYKVLFRVLKVTGDPTNEDDFESWLSDIIGVQVPPS